MSEKVPLTQAEQLFVDEASQLEQVKLLAKVEDEEEGPTIIVVFSASGEKSHELIIPIYDAEEHAYDLDNDGDKPPDIYAINLEEHSESFCDPRSLLDHVAGQMSSKKPQIIFERGITSD